MAAKKTLSGVISDECTCPVCLEDFLEPKTLPNCAHNVCKKCLEKIVVAEEKEIRCPVCRKESNIPSEGVSGFPTNCLIVKLLEASPGRLERIELRRCLETMKDELQTVERDLRKLGIQKQERLERCETLKSEITTTATSLVKFIRKQEKELCGKVDDIIAKDMEILGYDKRKEECEGIRKELRDFVSKTEAVLKNSDGTKIAEMKERLIQEGKTVKNRAKKIYTEEPHSIILLTRFEKIVSLRKGFGRIKTGTEIDFELDDGGRSDSFSSLNGSSLQRTNGSFVNSIEAMSSSTLSALDLSIPVFQSACITRTILGSVIGLESISPVAIASNPVSGDIAVAEPDNNRILVLNGQGGLRKRIASGSLPYSGVAFTGDGEIITVYSSKELLYIDPNTGKISGNFKTTDHGVRHRSVTCDQTGRLIVTSEPSSMFYKSAVCIYGANNNINAQRAVLKFPCHGSSLTSSPFKAIYHRGEYFVSDTAKGCIIVYNEQGNFERQFGAWGSMLRRGNGRNRNEYGELTSPTGIALDPTGENLLVCDVSTKSIQMYTTSGQFMSKYVLDGKPSDITVLRDGTIVICSKTDHWIKFLSLSGTDDGNS